MYKHRRVFPPSLIWCLLVGSIFLLIQCAQTDFTLSTHELELKLDNRGKVSSLAVLGKQYQNLENIANSGFYVVEYPTEDRYEVTGGVKRRGNTISQRAEVDGGELRISAEYNSQYDGYLTVSGEVEDLSGRDRGIDLIYQLPVEAAGWYWWEDITSRVRIESGEEYGTDIYPIGCVSSEEEEGGIGMGVAADYPCIYSIEYNPEQSVLLIRFKFGLTQDAKPKLKGRAPFKFLIFPVDPQWGFRDGLATYYRVYSDIFKRKAMKDGLILVEGETLAHERESNPKWNPDYFCYSVTGGRADLWIGEEPEREALGIDSYVYSLPGQLELKYLEKLPDNDLEAMEAYNDYEKKTPKKFRQINQFRYDLDIKPLIESASLRDKDGKYIIRIRNKRWGGNMVTFPLNPDPDVLVNEGNKNFTSILFSKLKALLKVYPTYDGIFFDSFANWGQYLNYRREHFEYADLPLTHDKDGNIYIHNTLSHWECLKAMKEEMNSLGAMVMGNGIRPYQLFNAFYLDVLCVETGNFDVFPWNRIMAYQKPFHVLGSRESMEEPLEPYLKNSTLYALLPSRLGPVTISNNIRSNLTYTEDDVNLIDRYIPVILKESSLGWEPIPYALSSDAEIQVERFGPREGRIMFAIYNRSDKPKSISLDINTSALNIAGIDRVESMIKKQRIEPKNPLKLTLGPRELEVILIGDPY
jgi:hypothetical protein